MLRSLSYSRSVANPAQNLYCTQFSVLSDAHEFFKNESQAMNVARIFVVAREEAEVKARNGEDSRRGQTDLKALQTRLQLTY
jgi:hypothetical protein